MTDRYEFIRAAEDLGGIEMFPDRTPDLVKKNAPEAAPTASRGQVQATHANELRN
ncbi:hypothetical protein [Williamsia herbipolensis]|uniref:hypothetical protein n=1 Tax=Williamsia herbipolensis TaxID=1603258 RepID=UPI001364C860|nr:hypothetical protein [Williamsia herbipolensis]